MRQRGYNNIMSDWTTPDNETIGERRTYAFKVERRPVKYDSPFELHGTREFEKRVVLLRADNAQPLAVVSDKYHPVTHVQLVDHFDAALKESGIYFRRRFTMVNKGEQIRIEYRFPDVKVMVNESAVEMTLTIVNSFDRTTGVMIRMGAFVMVCSNGMVIGRVLAWLKRTHRTKDLGLADMSSRLGELAAQFSEYQTDWDAMMSRGLSQLAAEDLFTRLFDKKQTKDVPSVSRMYHTPILNRFRSEPQTVWGLYNAITYIASHSARGMAPTLALMDFANRVQGELMHPNPTPANRQLPPSTMEGGL